MSGGLLRKMQPSVQRIQDVLAVHTQASDYTIIEHVALHGLPWWALEAHHEQEYRSGARPGAMLN